MDEARELLTAAELDRLSPDERAAAFRDRIVTNLDDLDADFRDRVEQTARRVASQLPAQPGE